MYMTRRITRALLSMIVLLSLTLASQGAVRAIGVIRYVSSTSGVNAGSCTSASSPCLTINYAIGRAAAGDTIKVAVGTYSSSPSGPVVVVSKHLTLSGGWDVGFVSHGGRSTIDGGKAHRGIVVNSGITALVDRFIVQNGVAVYQGAGIDNSGTLTLANSRVSQNLSRWAGGGIFNAGALTIKNSTISDNTAGDAKMSGGGGGGGIEVYGGTALIDSTTISGNKIVGGFNGSAIHVMTTSTVTLNKSTVSGNSGATALESFGTLTLNNSTVSGNTAPWQSAGIVIRGGSLTLGNSTITGNTIINGCGRPTGTGGIQNYLGYSGPVTLGNSIVAGNTGTCGSRSDCMGQIGSAGYNLVGTNSGCTLAAATGDLVGTENLPVDPRLLPLAKYGGPTRTHALTSTSPAFGAGNPGTPGAGGGACLSVDQRGVTRPQGARCDMGAYEAQFPLVKSISRADPNPTSASAAKFNVTFSTTVTGVNKTAPFSDFKLATTGVTGAAISAVTGWGNTYSVTVKTGSGNGSIKLNLIDDGSIHDGKGNQLGGPGPRNGNFPTGQSYTIIKTSSPTTPDATSWERLPTCPGSKIPAATQNQCQLARDLTTMYTKTILSSACGTLFTGTSSTVPAPAIGS